MSQIISCIMLALLASSLACNRAETSARKQTPARPPQASSSPESENPCVQFNQLNTLIRDGLVGKEAAHNKIKELLPKIRAYFQAKGGTDSPPDTWVFPVEGYHPRSIGGVKGKGYVPKGYDYFDGNKHGGHAAHDIFITDKNQDELDDVTGKPVNVLSMRNGVVVASVNEWPVGSELRGGRYVYVFDPALNSLIYYAHNREVLVKPGDLVKAGQALATVGRSGKSAYASRSPTHLHIMQLVFEDGYPKPNDLYQALLRARR